MKKTAAELRRDVIEELEWEPSVEATHIAVAVDDGIVTLTGAVPTYAEKLAAERVAQRVHGVRGIANDIEVRLPGTAHRDDTDIAKAAADAMKYRSGLPAGRIQFAVTKGWITLEGDVDWQYQRSYAEDAVRYLLGVKGVTNLISVKPCASPTEVKSRIESAFRRSAEIDAHQIKVEAKDGKVSLRGSVRSWSERQEAERTAWAAPGVTGVENHILIA